MRLIVILSATILLITGTQQSAHSRTAASPNPRITPLPDSGVIELNRPLARWVPDSVKAFSVLQGSSSVTTAAFTAHKLTGGVRLLPSQELTGLVIIQPESLLSVPNGDTVFISVVIAASSEAAFGQNSGFVRLVSLQTGTEVCALGLSVAVSQPSTDAPPDQIAIPTGDRITVDAELGVLRVGDELLVLFNQGASPLDISNLLSTVGGVIQGFDQSIGVYQVRFPNKPFEDLPAYLSTLSASPIVDFASYHLLCEQPTTTLPNDPMFDDWDELSPAGNNYGQELIKLPSAWSIQTGSSEVRVAVIDHGFDIHHPDLAANIESYSSIPGNDIAGNSHGTHVAGIIGATGDNGEGIAGTAWNCRLLLYNNSFEPIRFALGIPYRSARVGSFLWMWKFMQKAVDDGANVVNISQGIGWDGRTPSTPADLALVENQNKMLSNAIEHAYTTNREVLWVFSAGNEGVDASFDSPASLADEFDNVLAVAAVGSSATLSSYSNRGSMVKVAAPGNNILSTVPQNLFLHGDCYESLCPPVCLEGAGRYTCKTGTSMAAPFVAGVGALILSEFPDLSASEVRHRVVQGSINGGLEVAGQDFFVLNAFESLIMEDVGVTVCPGNALQFDGSDDYVQIPNSSTLSFGGVEQMTVELWFNLSQARANYDLLSKRPTCAANYNYQLHVGAGLLTFLNQSFKIEAPFAATVGQWYHVAATCDLSQAKLYVNGDLMACGPGGLGTHQNNYEVTFGRAGGCALSTPFVGEMDEVRIWNVARTVQQIEANFSRTVDPNSLGLVGYWNFDEASGQVVDRSGQHNDGTLLNGAHRVASTAQTCNTSVPPPGTFEFTGGPQTWLVPNGVTSINVDIRGAQGGGNAPWGVGGKGGRVQTTLAVTPGETLRIYVGGRGGALCSPNTRGPGGFNGGGEGGYDNVDGNGPAPGGGGASDIRQGGDSPAHRVVVAAGGGGSECCSGANGGDGGGTVGLAGGTAGGGSGPGGGGTPAAGGPGGGGCNGNGSSGGLGQGGHGGNGNRAGGGGGGGYYGGGGGGGCGFGSGGGGGSSYTVGMNITHTPGFQTGDGRVIITPAPVAGYTGDALPSGEMNKSMAQQSSDSITAPTNYPNPFNAGTVISYTLAEPGRVKVEIFNVLGQSVGILVDEVQTPGTHSLNWDGRDSRGASLASGVYFYRLSTSSSSQVKKMVIVK